MPTFATLFNQQKQTKMKKGKFFIYDTVKIPLWAMPAVINGDYSGLQDCEIEQILAFLHATPANFAHFVYKDSWYFSYFPKFGLACDVVDVDIICKKIDGRRLRKARRIASNCHIGQWSALYSFASSGIIAFPKSRYFDEIGDCKDKNADWLISFFQRF